ncbi:MAG: hypothetical protein R3F43_10960 [bacterium]
MTASPPSSTCTSRAPTRPASRYSLDYVMNHGRPRLGACTRRTPSGSPPENAASACGPENLWDDPVWGTLRVHGLPAALRLPQPRAPGLVRSPTPSGGPWSTASMATDSTPSSTSSSPG